MCVMCVWGLVEGFPRNFWEVFEKFPGIVEDGRPLKMILQNLDTRSLPK